MKASAKKVPCLVLALLLIGALVPPTQAAEYEADSAQVQDEVPQLPVEKDAPAELTAEGEWLTVPGIEGGRIRFDSSTGAIAGCENAVTVANIPAQIGGIAVTSIRNFAFAYCTNLTSVTIPDSVTSIGSSAFSDCNSLTSILTDANNPQYASQGGVLFNKSLSELIQYPPGKKGSYAIPSSVTSIGDSAFSGCTGLTSITIPNSVTSMGYYTFQNCVSLTDVTIPASVNSIGEGAFMACEGLISVTIPASVNSIGNRAFSGCTGLTSILTDANNPQYASQGGVLFNKSLTELIQYPLGKKGSYAIPSSVASIGDSAFEGCTGLTSITIPNSVTSMGYYTFQNCVSLTDVTIPASVNSIGILAFRGCTGLTSILTDANNPQYASRGGVLFNKSLTELIQYPLGKKGSYAIPSSVASIGDSAFRGCTGLTNITIPNGVTTIGQCAFQNCHGLTNITIPSSVNSIGILAFGGCTGLIHITISSGVVSIRDHAFFNCSNLASVAIPSSMTYITYYAFYHCDSLTDVYYGGTEAQWQTISIDAPNISLADVAIHYNSNGNEVLSTRVEKAILSATVMSQAGATAYCAFYGVNGRMLQVTSEALAEGLTELSFPIPGGATRVKVMLLSPEQLPLCLSKEMPIP